ncbi:hypothetical protein B0A49_01444 [Cryomyces minteri]|uniref:endo-1,3(4)-beta-glucanase n=1 Tax=Cryomyces minteri TaxID=331657 RepID=A0A4U0XNA4_9PEZI|nr:hypothetical protein B0A49_01444 [Cryomyces minteri]
MFTFTVTPSKMFTSYTLLVCLVLARLGTAAYVLEDDYSPANFFSMFTFFTAADPTAGFVSYVNQATAQSSGLINSTATSVYMGVDHTNVTPNGRPSVRLTSTKSYNSGLIILDLNHMPGGICGTWPAFWTFGPNWPNSGEIDIIEGVNSGTTNAMTLHVADNCTITNNNAFSGSISTTNCSVTAVGQAANVGCGITTTDTLTYGTGFNANGGGVYATEWTGTFISVYFFPRGSIPADITNGNPVPSGWGRPVAQFQGNCDIASKFVNQQIVFDTTFCGSWAERGLCRCSLKLFIDNLICRSLYHHFEDYHFDDHHFNGLHFNDHGSGSGSPGIYHCQDYLRRLFLFHELCRGVIFYFFNDFHSLSHNPHLFCECCERGRAVYQLHYALGYNERREPPDHDELHIALNHNNSSRISSERRSSAGNEGYDVLHALHYDDSSRFGSECRRRAGHQLYDALDHNVCCRFGGERRSSAGNEVYDVLHALHYDGSSRVGGERGRSPSNEVYYVFHYNELDDSFHHNYPWRTSTSSVTGAGAATNVPVASSTLLSSTTTTNAAAPASTSSDTASISASANPNSRPSNVDDRTRFEWSWAGPGRNRFAQASSSRIQKRHAQHRRRHGVQKIQAGLGF